MKRNVWLILILGMALLTACSSSADSGEGKPGLSDVQKTELATSQPYQWGQRTKTTGCKTQNGLPDPACTPGSITQANKDELCKSAGSADENIPDSLRQEVFQAYNLSEDVQNEYQLDVLVPPSLGGKLDISNVWPQAKESSPGIQQKDKAEQYLHEQVCMGTMTLEEAQVSIAHDWRDVYTHITD